MWVLALTGRRVVFVVVLELLGGDGLTKVEGEGVEDVILGVGKGRVLRDLRPAELCVSDGGCHSDDGWLLGGALGRSDETPGAFSAEAARSGCACLCASDFTAEGGSI